MKPSSMQLHYGARKFYRARPAPCPYLPQKKECKVFTCIDPHGPTINHDAFLHAGYRRSQNIYYRPDCSDCRACVPVRVRVKNFNFTPSLKRVWLKNADIVATPLSKNCNEKEQFTLFLRYLKNRHATSPMGYMGEKEYTRMVQNKYANTLITQYRIKEKKTLIGTAITDKSSLGLSMNYSFFDPSCKARSIGTFMILYHIVWATRSNQPFVYLGYWVENAKTMAYKQRFSGLEMLQQGQWTPREKLSEKPSTL